MRHDQTRQRVPDLDFEKFHKQLDRCAVRLPEYAPGEVIDTHELVRLMVLVQSRRQILDRIASKLNQRLGMLKRRIDVLSQQLKLERALALDEQGVKSQRNKQLREAQVEFLVSNLTGAVAILSGRKHQYEHALQSVVSQVKSMETAKQTLNSIKAIALGHEHDSRDTFQ